MARALLVPTLLAALAASLPAGGLGLGSLRGWAPGSIPVKRRTLATTYRPTGTSAVKVAFFDADSTLRVSRSGNVSANGPRDVELLPGVAEKLRQLAEQGYLLAVVSNQGGVAAGFVALEDADAALAYTLRLLARHGAPMHYYDFAEAKDENRKPDIGMARILARVLHEAHGREVDWRRSLMVGDSGWKRKKDVEPDGSPGEDFSNSDRLFAVNVRNRLAGGEGFVFHHPRTFFGWVGRGVRNFRKFEVVRAFKARFPED
jgi:DNA 3'-phosphatase